MTHWSTQFLRIGSIGMFALSMLTWMPSSVHAAPSAAKKAKPATKAKKAKKTKTEAERVAKRNKEHKRFLAIMRKELNRNIAQFKKMPRPPVYSFRYRMVIRRTVSIRASDGKVMWMVDNRKSSPARSINVNIRVGNHAFDQTGRDGYDWRVYRTLLPVASYCPKELTSAILQKKLWQMTDYKYRIAAAQYWRKRYVRSTKPKILDKAGDFSKEPPTVYMAPLDKGLPLDVKKWKGILKRVTRQSSKAIRVIRSGATIKAWETIILGVGMDGSMVRLRKSGYDWGLSLQYLGKSKEFVGGSDAGYSRTLKGLPSEADLSKKFLQMWQKAKAKTEAPEGDPDDGPAIVDPALAGAMFYDILLVRLSSQRFLRKRDERVFANKMNQRIIPSFLSVIDDPLRQTFQGITLGSHYKYDDEWVPARRLTMVKDGVLKNFYLSRKPYKKYKRSNGHGRGQIGMPFFSRPGMALIQSKKQMKAKAMLAKLIAEAKRQGKEYGYILKRFGGVSSVRRGIYTVAPEQVFRVSVKTGKVELVKGLRVRTAALQIIRGILATGDDYSVFNGSDSEDSGTIKITTIAPSLLIRRLVFDRVNLSEKKSYELAPPFKPVSLKDIKPSTQKAPVCPKTCPEICRRCPACQSKK